MSPLGLLAFALAGVALLFIHRHRSTWFDPGWTLPLRIALFALAMPIGALAIIIAIGTFLTAIGGIG